MRFFFLPFLFFISTLFGVDHQPIALVSLAPYRTFVREIAGDTLQVELMVPPGASAHSYEPTAKQMILASQADIWFFLGEPFEKKALQALQSAKPDLQVVDLRTGVTLLHEGCLHCKASGEDLHIWLSPRWAKLQAATIAEALSKRYPQNKDFYKKNLTAFSLKLDTLDKFIKNTLAPIKNRVLMVSHPAYGYFCEEYGFTQVPIEIEGKDPTQKQMTELLDKARLAKTRFILTQPQYSDKAAKLVAEQVNAKVIVVDPYSENYEDSLRLIATIIAENS